MSTSADLFAGKPAKPSPGLDWLWLLTPLAIHAIALVVTTIVLTIVPARFADTYRELSVPLPVLTQLALNGSRVLQQGWFLLVPVALASDFLLGYWACRTGQRRLIWIWAVSVILLLVASILLSAVVLMLPLSRLTAQMP